MKKILSLLLIAILGFTFISCEDTNPVDDNDTYSYVFDVNASFTNSTSGYVISRTWNNPLYDTDMILVYRKSGTTSNGAAIWQQIPRTLFLGNSRELDYDFDFSRYDVQIYAGGNYDVTTTPEYLNNQTFRVVVVPASKGGKNANVNYDDYDSVIKYFNINDSQVTKL